MLGVVSFKDASCWFQRNGSLVGEEHRTRNKYENIPQDILSNIDKIRVDDSPFLTELKENI